MSRESRQRLREEAKRQEARLACRKRLFPILPIIGIAAVAIGSLAWIHPGQNPQKPGTTTPVQTPSFSQPETLKELLALSPAELEHCEIARMNLLCAEGLPGAENLNVDEDLATLDQWVSLSPEIGPLAK